MSPDAAPPEQMLQPGDNPNPRPAGASTGTPTAKLESTTAPPHRC